MNVKSRLTDETKRVDVELAKMFGAVNQVVQLRPEMLQPYPNQPFHIYTDEKMFDMCESIAKHGILAPIIVRQAQGATYQILSGHNRWTAAKLLKIEYVPCIVLNVDDKDAAWIVATANLQQRDVILPSERAFACKMQIDNEKRQGARNDLADEKRRTDEVIAERMKKSRSTIQFYAKLATLQKGLLDLVDSNDLKVTAAYSLSALNSDQQQFLLEYMYQNSISKITPEQAKLIALNKQSLTEQELKDALNTRNDNKPNLVPSVAIKIPKELLQKKYRKLTPDEELLKKIAEVIDAYYNEKNGIA